MKSVSTPCDFVFNLVVDDSHIVIINNFPLFLLDHNYTTGILDHSYLGTKKVIEDLSIMPGFPSGNRHNISIAISKKNTFKYVYDSHKS